MQRELSKNEIAYEASLIRMQKAEATLRDAMDELHSATSDYMRKYYELTDRNDATMISVAKSNRATWSGGCTSVNNILETIKRDCALNVIR